MPTSDERESVEELIDRVHSGDRDAFRGIVRRYSASLRGYLACQLRHMEDVDDIAQDVFITAYRKLDRFREGDFGAWLRAIARNEVLMHMRTAARRDSALGRFRQRLQQAMVPDYERAADQFSSRLVDRLRTCIERLPERMKQVVRHGLEGAKASALASSMNTSVGAVYNLQYRANGLLRECLDQETD
ncbi:MAG: sigma-70 family RNA polymerase sigma factor [Planctomycetaceae bacterium]|nr:sigma-70 family RNA polymerase sigma factor [Planctomycetaceae bacterium]